VNKMIVLGVLKILIFPNYSLIMNKTWQDWW
jgi:hypothetical protein